MRLSLEERSGLPPVFSAGQMGELSPNPSFFAPRMSASAKVVVRVLSVAMNAPTRTAATPTIGYLQAEDWAGSAPESTAIGGAARSAVAPASAITASLGGGQ